MDKIISFHIYEYYSFPQKNRRKNQTTKEEGRWHLDESLMQRAVKLAALEAGINKIEK